MITESTFKHEFRREYDLIQNVKSNNRLKHEHTDNSVIHVIFF